MEIPDRTLIGLKLILEQFGIAVAVPLMVKSTPPNMDRIVSVIALMQVAHPMGYSFYVEQDEIGYHVRSNRLTKHIFELRKKSTRGDFILTGKRYGMSRTCRNRIEAVLKHTTVPESVPFSQQEWTLLVGLWAALHESVNDEKILEIILSDYIEFLPYVGWAEEAVTLIRTESARAIV